MQSSAARLSDTQILSFASPLHNGFAISEFFNNILMIITHTHNTCNIVSWQSPKSPIHI